MEIHLKSLTLEGVERGSAGGMKNIQEGELF